MKYQDRSDSTPILLPNMYAGFLPCVRQVKQLCGVRESASQLLVSLTWLHWMAGPAMESFIMNTPELVPWKVVLVSVGSDLIGSSAACSPVH